MMSREETYQLKYTIALIAEFAKKFHLGKKQAYNYLKRFNGLGYLKSYIKAQGMYILIWIKNLQLETTAVKMQSKMSKTQKISVS